MAIPELMNSPSGSERVGCNNTRALDINLPASEEMEQVEEEEGDGTHRQKKLRLSKEQSRLLEESFRQNHTLNTKQKEVLASRLKLKPRQVEVWFQNRRARTKLKQTEMECEYLKRCFGSLTEENKLLQHEVEELRAMRGRCGLHRPSSSPLKPVYTYACICTHNVPPMPACRFNRSLLPNSSP